MSLNKLYIDLEVYAPDDFASPELVKYPIVCASIFDTTTNHFATYVWRKDLEFKRAVDWFWSKAFDCPVKHIITYDNDEHSMLLTLIEDIVHIDPDLLLGWNIEGFDLPYLVRRAKKLAVNVDMLSPFNVVSSERIKGRLLIDLYPAFRKAYGKTLRSTKLFMVCKDFLKLDIPHNPKMIPEWYMEDLERLVLYNASHVDACVALDNAFNLSDYMLNVSYVSGARLEDVYYSTSVITTMLQMLKPKDLIFPTKTGHVEYEEYEGAIVFEPMVGVLENVAVLDVSATYPSVIISCNISPETLVDDGYSGECSTLPNGARFRLDVEGMVPMALKQLLSFRKKVEAELQGCKDPEMYSVLRQKVQSIKAVINSTYGVFGYPGYKLYNPKIPEAIASVGREILKFMKGIIEKCGFKLCAGHTDSCHVLAGSTIEEAVENGASLVVVINSSFSELAERLGVESHVFKVDLEKVYKSAFYGGKKTRYAGLVVYEKGRWIDPPRLDIKGFEYRRADSAKITQEVQERVFELILNKKGKEAVDSYLKEVVGSILAGSVPLVDLAVSKGIRKPLSKYKKVMPQHVRAALYSNQHLKTNFKAGDRVYVVKVKRTGSYPKTDVVGIDETTELPTEIVVDYKQIAKDTVIDKIQPVYEALGWLRGGQQRLM